MPESLQIAAIALATLGAGATTMTAIDQDVPDFSVPEAERAVGSVLDGRSFHILGKNVDSGETLEDELIFRDGTFQSTNCQECCDFGWSNCRTTIRGDAIHVTARTECPDAPHTVVWYGTVKDDEVRVEGTRTTRRWHWTHQIRFAASETEGPAAADGVTGQKSGEGLVAPEPALCASGRLPDRGDLAGYPRTT